MRNTAQPLSIAYIGDDGSVGTILEMAPCEDEDGCPTYPAEEPFRWAVEVPTGAGGVAALGLEERRRPRRHRHDLRVLTVDSAASGSAAPNPDTPPAYDRRRAEFGAAEPGR